MKGYKYLMMIFLISGLIQACDSEKKETAEEKKETPAVVIDSSAFKAKKTDIKNFKVVEEVELSSAAEVEKLVKAGSLSDLNDYQKFAQEFISASATKNYTKAASYLAYTGSDKSRVGTDHFIFANANEKGVVKTTVDVVYNFLAESNDFKFISSKEGKNKKGQDVQILEITFFKKGIAALEAKNTESRLSAITNL